MGTPIPSNKARFSVEELLRVTSGKARGVGVLRPVVGVSTDTRTLRAGELFVALTGERFDGHQHLDKARAAGAACALVERKVEAPEGMLLVQVSSTLLALGALSAYHRRRWQQRDPERKLVAITGSAGKTTTKEAVVALLLKLVGEEAVHLPPGNLNNLIGVPMTLLGLNEKHRYGVLELGTNAPGEIFKLAAMVQPQIAVVTLIAQAHTEGLGSIEAVAREKTALFRSLNPKEGIAVGNLDDSRVATALSQQLCKTLGYGHAVKRVLIDYAIEDKRITDALLQELTLRCPGGHALPLTTPLLGRAGALATAAAVTVVEALGLGPIDADVATAAFRRVRPSGRLELCEADDGLMVIDDSYNANPASMRASIELAAQLAKERQRRLVLVLGEMRELGRHSAEEHALIGAYAAQSGAAEVIAVAGDAAHLASVAEQEGCSARFVPDAYEAQRLACATVERNDVVLVKGSRGVHTEVVVEALLEQHEGHTRAGVLGTYKEEQ